MTPKSRVPYKSQGHSKTPEDFMIESWLDSEVEELLSDLNAEYKYPTESDNFYNVWSN